MVGWFSLNKYTALAIILIILIICYFVTKGKKEHIKKGGRVKKNKKNSKSPKKSKAKFGKRGNSQNRQNEEEFENNDFDESGDEDGEEREEDNINKDAEELYNIAHDGLCNGIQSEEFEELAGDLADTSVFIELKQLYNQCTQKGLDPSKTITVNDYVRILKEENI